MFYWPEKNSAGELNSFKASDFDSEGRITQADLDAYEKHPDPLARLYPIGGKLKNQVEAPGDNTTESFDDGTTAITITGVMTMNARISNVPPQYKAKIDALVKCRRGGFIFADENNKLIGQDLIGDMSQLFPRYIDEASFSTRWFPSSAANVPYIEIVYEFGRENLPENILYAETDANFLAATGIITVDPKDNGVNDGIEIVSDTETRVYANTCFGLARQIDKAVGLNDATDWTIELNGSPLVISSVEDTDINGIYLITHDTTGGSGTLTVSGGTTTLDKCYEIIERSKLIA
jgi:hypothetical protein